MVISLPMLLATSGPRPLPSLDPTSCKCSYELVVNQRRGRRTGVTNNGTGVANGPFTIEDKFAIFAHTMTQAVEAFPSCDDDGTI